VTSDTALTALNVTLASGSEPDALSLSLGDFTEEARRVRHERDLSADQPDHDGAVACPRHAAPTSCAITRVTVRVTAVRSAQVLGPGAWQPRPVAGQVLAGTQLRLAV
jgi:hypothetical protein